MKTAKDWIIPAVSFCTFVIMIIIAILLAYEKIAPIGKIHRVRENQQGVTNQDITNMEDFQKALNSSLK